ncbi:MAG: thiamine pyrophosphate-dependent enzyme [Acidobacteriota bacterium]
MQNVAQKRAAANQGFEAQTRQEATVVATVADQLAALGVEEAFGVSGGAIALIFDALEDSSITLRHFRHESGAAFAAAEAHFATDKPTVVFATTGPGLLNSLTGMTAARWDGAKVILISGATNSPQRGRWASQETSSYTLPQDALYTRGPIFDFAVRMEHASELPEVLRRVSLGLSAPGGFIAHICMPMSVQSKRIDVPRLHPRVDAQPPTAPADIVAQCAQTFKSDSFAIWAGFGATKAAAQIQQLAERTGAMVFCSPRAKGILPEDHPQFLGVTGLGGHESVTDYMVQRQPKWLLVLGTRLGEATSFWDTDMVPQAGFIHVDIDPTIPGTSYPEAHTLGIQADAKLFLEDLLQHFPRSQTTPAGSQSRRREPSETLPMRLAGSGPVRPQALMRSIQRLVVDQSEALVLSECGNSFAWCNHYLRFPTPGRYRVSTLFGSMGHTATGVVGAALATGEKAVAVVGDGSMLMNSEISSAAQYQAPAVWIVLNDAGYGMCRDGHCALGLTDANVEIPRVDFVGLARSMGAEGARVETEDQIDDAIQQALEAFGPFIIDVDIDTNEASPLLRRFESLIKQGNSKNVAGWEA